MGGIGEIRTLLINFASFRPFQLSDFLARARLDKLERRGVRRVDCMSAVGFTTTQ